MGLLDLLKRKPRRPETEVEYQTRREQAVYDSQQIRSEERRYAFLGLERAVEAVGLSNARLGIPGQPVPVGFPARGADLLEQQELLQERRSIRGRFPVGGEQIELTLVADLPSTYRVTEAGDFVTKQDLEVRVLDGDQHLGSIYYMGSMYSSQGGLDAVEAFGIMGDPVEPEISKEEFLAGLAGKIMRRLTTAPALASLETAAALDPALLGPDPTLARDF